MPQVKQINIKQIFEKQTGRKVTHEEMRRNKPPVTFSMRLKVARNIGEK